MHNNVNILSFIRRNIGLFKGKQFDSGLDNLQTKIKAWEKYMPEDWTCKKHDRALLKYVAKNGLKCFSNPDITFEETGRDAFPLGELDTFQEFLEKEAPDLL